MSPLRISFYALLFFIGFLLFLNGFIHALFYFIDDSSLFSGLRYINWLTLLVGAVLSSYSYYELDKPNQFTT